MTPERWQQICDLLQSAMTLEPAKRPAYLDHHCSSDPSLRKDVDSFLAAEHKLRTSFLESQAIPQVVPDPNTASGAVWAAGMKLEPYEIHSLLGAGGMGVVYRARDTRLGRAVAIKVLPAHLSADPSRLKRFEQEAQSAAALNHPNILAVYQLGSYQGAPYLVSELLEGETLREKLKSGALSQQHAMDYAEQVADGLSAAHERGIIHRDLKPENLFVTKDNRLKILDFGLAKLLQQDTAETVATLGLQTHPGIIAGTVAYMSPEQARGEKLDVRTDLFSFGVVLYEMVTGKRPFDGDTSGIVFEAILTRQPTPPTKLNAKVVPELERIITKALEKDRDVRYQHASDIRADLKRLRRNTESGQSAALSTVSRRKVPRMLGLFAVAVTATILAGFVAWKAKWIRPEQKKQLVQRDITANSSDNQVRGAAISPDGKQLAYADSSDGLSLVQVDTGEKRSFPSSVALVPISWFPDGTHILVTPLGTREIRKMSTVDGAARKLLDAKLDITAAAVSPDGSQIAFLKGDDEIWVVGANGEDPHRILSLGPSFSFGLAWSPTSRRIVFSMEDRTPGHWKAALESCNPEGAQRVLILSDTRLRGPNQLTDVSWSVDGRVFYSLREPRPNANASDNIWAMKVNPDTGRVEGQSLQITGGLGFARSNFSESVDGRRFAFLRTHQQDTVRIAEIQQGGRALGASQSLRGENWDRWPTGWTKDSKAVIYDSIPPGRREISKQDLQTHQTQSLLSGSDNYRGAVVSPDGQWLLFTQNPSGASRGESARLMRMAMNGGPATSVLSGAFSYDCASQADMCVIAEDSKDRRIFSSLDPVKGRGSELARADLVSEEYGWSLSADGRTIAALTNSDKSRVQIIRIGEPGSRAIELNGWYLQGVSWAPDNLHLYVSANSADVNKILLVGLNGSFKVLLEDSQSWLAGPKPSPDGRHLAFLQRDYETNVVMLENY